MSPVARFQPPSAVAAIQRQAAPHARGDNRSTPQAGSRL